MTLNILILAAGLGTRMKSEKSKVMHEILGRPMLEYIFDSSEVLSPSRIILLLSPNQKDIFNRYKNRNLFFATQERPLGTGDAVKSALQELEESADLMVLAGDVPLITVKTLQKMYESHLKEMNSITFLTMNLDNPKGYGRVYMQRKKIRAIIEEKDASDKIKKINEVNSGIYTFSYDFLTKNINGLRNENAQKEYYITDLVKIAYDKNEKTQAIMIDDANEVSGINDRQQLGDIEQIMLKRKLETLMKNGVTIRNPQTVYIDDSVKVFPDTEIKSNVVLKGNTIIENKCTIGEFSFIKNGLVKSGSEIKPHTIIDE
ncbi:MAG: hypothetical protein COX48_00600 [bacterium (Candidatus Stahlbacteria) CG23_combo_of_CG06-09_8_20_14_all_34_7]|nr:MAG: hypothetical protein COX48_00600 [bacterium (Candidatus Stahlbacteria) CG23_combo_of_CG06-09_8_20_14_all_34_7]